MPTEAFLAVLKLDEERPFAFLPAAERRASAVRVKYRPQLEFRIKYRPVPFGWNGAVLFQFSVGFRVPFRVLRHREFTPKQFSSWRRASRARPSRYHAVVSPAST